MMTFLDRILFTNQRWHTSKMSRHQSLQNGKVGNSPPWFEESNRTFIQKSSEKIHQRRTFFSQEKGVKMLCIIIHKYIYIDTVIFFRLKKGYIFQQLYSTTVVVFGVISRSFPPSGNNSYSSPGSWSWLLEHPKWCITFKDTSDRCNICIWANWNNISPT